MPVICQYLVFAFPRMNGAPGEFPKLDHLIRTEIVKEKEGLDGWLRDFLRGGIWRRSGGRRGADRRGGSGCGKLLRRVSDVVAFEVRASARTIEGGFVWWALAPGIIEGMSRGLKPAATPMWVSAQ